MLTHIVCLAASKEKDLRNEAEEEASTYGGEGPASALAPAQALLPLSLPEPGQQKDRIDLEKSHDLPRRNIFADSASKETRYSQKSIVRKHYQKDHDIQSDNPAHSGPGVEPLGPKPTIA
ncbi:hypothetical protein PENNAL_c0088G00437 [Penicillium nalgiovense]|uniref:Uncharacterized protein n=1 Tax=Penicillium nalgiovense TaxID=60175 RepID=A0A1V6XDX7_PENNA|nr:hypothetical protein PENNAL_c0088G00437 [Penicillium nalgiovense]